MDAALHKRMARFKPTNPRMPWWKFLPTGAAGKIKMILEQTEISFICTECFGTSTPSALSSSFPILFHFFSCLNHFTNIPPHPSLFHLHLFSLATVTLTWIIQIDEEKRKGWEELCFSYRKTSLTWGAVEGRRVWICFHVQYMSGETWHVCVSITMHYGVKLVSSAVSIGFILC